MQAVVECITDDAPPPVELRIAWQCNRWNTLPESGGLYEQDYRTLLLMTATSNIYNAVTRMQNLKGKRIHELTEAERKVIRVLVDNKILFHA